MLCVYLLLIKLWTRVLQWKKLRFLKEILTGNDEGRHREGRPEASWWRDVSMRHKIESWLGIVMTESKKLRPAMGFFLFLLQYSAYQIIKKGLQEQSVWLGDDHSTERDSGPATWRTRRICNYRSINVQQISDYHVFGLGYGELNICRV